MDPYAAPKAAARRPLELAAQVSRSRTAAFISRRSTRSILFTMKATGAEFCAGMVCG